MCSVKYEKEVMDSVAKAKNVLYSAERKWNKTLFTKWFGKSTAESNNAVKERFERAVKVMFARK